MYNINGVAIIGDISQGETPIYDSDDLLVAEAKYQARVRKSTDYIFYKTRDKMYKQVRNTQSNIYVLDFHNQKRYFINYEHAKEYLEERLMEESIIVS